MAANPSYVQTGPSLCINQKHAPASLQSTFISLCYLLLSQQKENIFEQECSCNCQKGGVQHDEGKATKTADDTRKQQSRQTADAPQLF